MFWKVKEKVMIEQEVLEIVPTGKIRVVQNPISFRFELEQQFSDGSHKPYAVGKDFIGVQDAKDWFILHKQNLRTNPADLGNINDA